MDYLFWRLPPEVRGQSYPWLLWYIWKGRNDKCFNNIDRCPSDIVQLAESEGHVWEEAQVLTVLNYTGEGQQDTNFSNPTQQITGRICQVDGSWKEGDTFSGQGWIMEALGSEVMMGVRNIHGSLSSLHAEFEALVWAMDCMSILQFRSVTFASDCSELVKMVSETTLWPTFGVHLEEFERAKGLFDVFNFIQIPRSTNSRADKLARSARVYPSCIIHVDVDVPTWLVESF